MFTVEERSKIRWYLGWPGRYLDTFTPLEQGMDVMSAEEETLIRAHLSKLDTLVDTTLPGTYIRLQAIKAGPLLLAADKEIMMLRSEGRRLVGQIAGTIGVPVGHDVFSPTGPDYDGFGYDGPEGGGSRIKF